MRGRVGVGAGVPVGTGVGASRRGSGGQLARAG